MIEGKCANPKCRATIHFLLLVTHHSWETGKLLGWHQYCIKCGEHFNRRGRWKERDALNSCSVIGNTVGSEPTNSGSNPDRSA